uniref:Peptidase S54 rhomboid domain-containing protein n=1 Tax=Fagus sylvatica TaxID=28930 RepID=A0A2N9J1K9_FAGSY
MWQLQFQQLQLQLRTHGLGPYNHSCKLMPLASISRPTKSPTFPPHSLSFHTQTLTKPNQILHFHPLSSAPPSRLVCNMNRSDMMSQLELGKPEERRRPEKQVNGIFWIILLNIGIFVADHLFQVRAIRSLYLYHNWPAWYQFLTATFCHANWNHLSSNLFFLYIFGVGANLVSWLVLPRNAVSVGASGAVFGLFTISVLVKMSWDWRKILEVLILGQFVIEKVMEAAQASTALSGTFRGGHSLQSVNHIAHLSGALVGVVLVWLLSKVPSQSPDGDVSTSHRGKDRTL